MPMSCPNKSNEGGVKNGLDPEWSGKVPSAGRLSEEDGEGVLRGKEGIYFFWHKNTYEMHVKQCENVHNTYAVTSAESLPPTPVSVPPLNLGSQGTHDETAGRELLFPPHSKTVM